MEIIALIKGALAAWTETAKATEAAMRIYADTVMQELGKLREKCAVLETQNADLRKRLDAITHAGSTGGLTGDRL